MNRIAILSTPRSGNMWLRRLLRTATAAREVSADTPAGVPWDDLPERVVLQLHWPPDRELVSRLDAGGFASLVLARHPLDVLVSILQFAQTESRTARWLNGAGGNELDLIGADPTSPAFAAYAVSERARRLLGVTPAWWSSGLLAGRVRYEDLVAEPRAELERLLAELRIEPVLPLDEVLARNTIAELRDETGSRHFWRGQPGQWRALLPPATVDAIAPAHEEAFATGGYDADADAGLTPDAARARWSELLATTPESRTPVRPSPYLAVEGDVARRLYEVALHREPDDQSLREIAERLENDTLSPSALLHDLVTSGEGRVARAVDDALTFARWARRNGERPRAIAVTRDTPEWTVGAVWALARTPEERDVLNVGSGYADPAYTASLADLRATHLGTADPVSVRALESRAFDAVLCVGTLHHVGSDNRAYGLGVERDPNGPDDALRALRDAVRPDGCVLVTVPCGAARDLGLFVQREAEQWLGAFERADFFVFEHEVYELTDDGWASCEPPYAAHGYGERGPGASALLCADLRPGRLRHAARRRVADATRALRRS